MNKNFLYYLSHPYTSFGDPVVNKQSAKHIELVLQSLHGISIVNPIVLIPDGETYQTAMKRCRSLYDACDAIILCPGWDKSKGCTEEYQWAINDRKSIYILNDKYDLVPRMAG